MFHQIDHLLFGIQHLQDGIDYIHELTGIKPIMGGSHPGLGTHNALMGLGSNIYLEIIAPDPTQEVERVWMDLDRLTSPRLFRWAAASPDIHATHKEALAAGIDIGEVKSGSRYKPDGTLLEWTLSDPNVDLDNGMVPFFINWGKKGNPTPQLPKGCVLKSFKVEHSNPDSLNAKLETLGLELRATKAATPSLQAEILSPKGMVLLK